IVNRRIYNRGPHPTPGRFETRVITKDVDPQIQIRYQSSKVKAYFKEQRALRVETTINDPYNFGVKRRLTADNWRGLRRAALQGVLDPIDGTHTYRVTPTGRRIATFFTKLAARAVIPTLTELEEPLRPHRPATSPVVIAWRAYEHEIRGLLDHAHLN